MTRGRGANSSSGSRVREPDGQAGPPICDTSFQLDSPGPCLPPPALLHAQALPCRCHLDHFSINDKHRRGAENTQHHWTLSRANREERLNDWGYLPSSPQPSLWEMPPGSSPPPQNPGRRLGAGTGPRTRQKLALEEGMLSLLGWPQPQSP